MHRKSVEVAQKMIDQPQEYQDHQTVFDESSQKTIKSESIANLRAKAQEHSEKISQRLMIS